MGVFCASMSAIEQIHTQVRTHCERGEFDAATTVALDHFGPEIVGFLVRALADETRGAEVFCLVAEDVWRGLPGFEWRSSLRTWLYVLARRAIARYSRSRRDQPIDGVPISRAPQLQLLVDRVRSSTAAYLRTDVKDRFASLRARLEPEERMLLTLRHDRKMRWASIAEVLMDDDCANADELRRHTDKVKKRYKRLLPRLKQLALEEGLFDDAD